MPLYVHQLSDVGRAREVNEDCLRAVRLDEDDWLLVVCDGMGGHVGGRLASHTAVDRIVGYIQENVAIDPYDGIGGALLSAHEAVVAAAAAGGVAGAGSTGVVARVRGDRLWYGWVGDSRFYHFRDGACMERSEDHTRVAELVRHGVLQPAQARTHPEAHVLSRVLGGTEVTPSGHQPSIVRPDEESPLRRGDLLVLCSDGLFDLLEDEEIVGACAGRDLANAAARLVELANERGGHDNISVILACVGESVVPPVRAVAPPISAEPPAAPFAAKATEESVPAPEQPRERPPVSVPLPVFVASVVAALILGIGLGLAIFGVVTALERPRPPQLRSPAPSAPLAEPAPPVESAPAKPHTEPLPAEGSPAPPRSPPEKPPG